MINLKQLSYSRKLAQIGLYGIISKIQFCQSLFVSPIFNSLNISINRYREKKRTVLKKKKKERTVAVIRKKRMRHSDWLPPNNFWKKQYKQSQNKSRTHAYMILSHLLFILIFSFCFDCLLRTFSKQIGVKILLV